MIRLLPEDVKMQIVKFSTKENANSIDTTLKPKEISIMNEIKHLDPSFSLLSYLMILQEEIKERNRLLSSPVYELYQMLGNHWFVEYMEIDGKFRFNIEIIDTDSLTKEKKIKEKYGAFIQNCSHSEDDILYIVFNDKFAPFLYGTENPPEDFLSDLKGLDNMFNKVSLRVSLKDQAPTQLFSNRKWDV